MSSTPETILKCLLVCALCVPLMGGTIVLHKKGASGAATDDFSTDTLGSDWIDTHSPSGAWTISGGVANPPVAGAGYIQRNDTRAADQYIVFQLKNATANLIGALMRHDGSGGGYLLRFNTGTTNAEVYTTTNHCDSGNSALGSAVIGSYGTYAVGRYYGFAVSGTGASTVFEYFDFGTSQPTGGYASWGGSPSQTVTLTGTYDAAGKHGFCSVGAMASVDWDDYEGGDI